MKFLRNLRGYVRQILWEPVRIQVAMILGFSPADFVLLICVQLQMLLNFESAILMVSLAVNEALGHKLPWCMRTGIITPMLKN